MNTVQPVTTLIDLLRHGEAEGGKKYRGITDDPLTELGKDQMWRVVGEHGPWDRIITSPLRRCAEFAQALSERSAIPLSSDPAFMGWKFGAWEGKTKTQILQTDAVALGNFLRDPLTHSPSGGEPLSDIAARATQALNGVLRDFPGERVLIITHSVTMRCVLVAKIFNMPLDRVFSIEAGFGAFTRLKFTHEPGGIRTRLLSHSGSLPESAVQST